ncbi:MAG TPA: permease [Thermoanaerobaculia bacterium]|nr:permease [Thermoanaerobaculia bacterium]HUM30409.1 permease [Thermoanaerobaculia bacterium]HXK68580.1 permease [Thermoanaerobaculia bacterium]
MIRNLLLDFLRESWHLFCEVSPFLILGFFFAGLIHVFIGKETIRRHLGGPGFIKVLKSVILGIPLPICSCGVIPLAASLRREGASKASVLSFLFATPVTGVDSILATYAFLGALFAVFRPLAALLGGILIGLASLFVEREPAVDLPPVVAPTKSTGHKIREVFTYGFLTLPEELGRWLIAGILLGGLISAIIPADFGQQYLSDPWVAYPLMLLISVPIYVCATGSIPIAAALIWKGLLPGAALTFLIAGPATNTVNAAFVWKEMGKKQFAMYLTMIVIFSTAMGLLFDAIWVASGTGSEMLHGAGEHLPLHIGLISSLILLPLLLRAYIPHRSSMAMPVDVENGQEFSIQGMTCQGCVSTVNRAIRKVNGVETVSVDLREGQATVTGDFDAEELVRAVQEAGYRASKTS